MVTMRWYEIMCKKLLKIVLVAQSCPTLRPRRLQSARPLWQFLKAAITKWHPWVSQNNRHLLSYSSGGYKSKSKVSTPSESSLFPVSNGCQQPLAFVGWKLHPCSLCLCFLTASSLWICVSLFKSPSPYWLGLSPLLFSMVSSCPCTANRESQGAAMKTQCCYY